MTTIDKSTTQELRLAHSELKATASRVADELRALTNDRQVVSTSETGELTYKLSRGAWVEVFPNIRMLLVDDSPKGFRLFDRLGEPKPESPCTRVLLEATSIVQLPRHRHSYNESVIAISGWMRDIVTGARINSHTATSTLTWKSNMEHEPMFQGIFLLCWTPPLEML